MEKTKGNKIIKNLIWTLLSLLIAVFTIRVLFLQNDNMSLRELFAVVAGADKVWLGLAILAGAAYVWFEGVAIRSILKFAGYPRGPIKGLIYSTSDVYFSAITPSATGGQPATALIMVRDGIPAGMATAVLVLNLMMYTLAVVSLGLLSILISPEAIFGFSSFSKFLIGLGVIGQILLSAFFLLLLKNGDIFFQSIFRIIRFLNQKGIVKERKKIRAKLEKIRNDYNTCSDIISGRKRILFRAFLWNLIQRGSQFLVPMLVYRALGGQVLKMRMIFSKQCLLTIGYIFIPIPGGMGISDYLMLDGFSRLMGEEMAYHVELISRGITFYLCVILSGLVTLVGTFYMRKKKQREVSP